MLRTSTTRLMPCARSSSRKTFHVRVECPIVKTISIFDLYLAFRTRLHPSDGQQERAVFRAFSFSLGGLVRPARRGAELAPTHFHDSDAKMFGSYLDVGERQIAFLIADVLYLIESRDRVANMRGIRHRLFARTREREGGFG